MTKTKPSGTASRVRKESRTRKRAQCALCKAKLTLVFQVCRCKRMFCPRCTMPEIHNCPNISEFKNAARERLKNEMKIEGKEKVDKI